MLREDGSPGKSTGVLLLFQLFYFFLSVFCPEEGEYTHEEQVNKFTHQFVILLKLDVVFCIMKILYNAINTEIQVYGKVHDQDVYYAVNQHFVNIFF